MNDQPHNAQSGVRSGVGQKPPRVPTAVLAGNNPGIRPGVGNVLRVIVASDATGNAVMGFGRFDGQELILECVSNGGDATLPNAPTSNVILSTDWDFDLDTTLTLVWDSRQKLWRESARGGLMAFLKVVLYDDDGNVIDTGVTNGVNEVSVSDAGVADSLTAIRKLLEQQTELLHRILKKGK